MMNREQIKNMVVMNIIDNSSLDLDNTGQQQISMNEKQFANVVDALVGNIEVIKN